MAFEGDLTNLGLADIFQTLGMNRQSGTLVVKYGDTERRFYFTDEGCSLLTSRSARKFRLGNLLVGMGKLSEGDLKVAVLKQERAKDTKIGDILLQTGLVKTDDIKAACRYQAAEEIYDSFNWKSGKFQFLEGANAGPQGGPGPFAEFFFPVTDIVMEAARRSDEFALNLQKVGDPKEFWIRKSPEPLDEATVGRTAALLHQMLDGTVDVQQAFEEFHLSPFDTCAAFAALIEQGAIQPTGPKELEAAAQSFLQKKDFSRAAKLLGRAAHHDPKNGLLLHALAEAQAAAGDKKEAALTLASLGRLYAELEQRTEAIDALHKAVQQDNRLESAYEMLMDIHALLDQFDKSEEACREAARLLSDDRSFDGALRLLDRGLKHVPDSMNLRLQRANCLLAMGQKDDGLKEMRDIALAMEEKKTDSRVRLGVYRKLAQLDPDNKEFKSRVDDLLAGERARESRKKLVRVAAAAGVLALVGAGFFLRPKSAGEKLEAAQGFLDANPTYEAAKADYDQTAATVQKILAGAAPGSEEGVRAQKIAEEIDRRKTARERTGRLSELEKRIQDQVLKPADEMIQSADYPGAIRKACSLYDLLKNPELAPLKGPDLEKMGKRMIDAGRKVVLRAADALRSEWKGIQSALGAVSAVEIPKADEERQRQLYETTGAALKSRERGNWKGTVEALAEASQSTRFGEIEGLRLTDLRRILEDMDSAMTALEDAYHQAHAAVSHREIRDLHTKTLKEVSEAKNSGSLQKGIDACAAFLARCDAVRREEPRKYFSPIVERLLDQLHLDTQVKEVQTTLVNTKAGLDRSKELEAKGEIQAAFDILRRTIGDAPDVNFQGLARLPLRIASRPPGARVLITLPSGEVVDAGTTPTPTFWYPYQGKTVVRVEERGFEPAVLERLGIEKDRDAVITMDLQRTLRWRREAGAAVEGRPGITGGLVLVGTRGGLFRALSADAGDEKFQLRTDHLSGISGGVLVDGGSAYFGGNDGEAFAVDVAKQSFRWRRKTSAPVSTMPARVGSLAAFLDGDGRLYGLRVDTGEPAWTVELKAPPAGDPIAAGDLVVAGLSDDRLVAIRADGSTAWTARLSGPPVALAPDGRGGVLAGTESSTVERVDLAKGSVTWVAKTDAPVHARPCARPDGVVALSTQGTLFRLDPGTGKETTPRASLGRSIEGGCTVLGDLLYAAADNGVLVTFDLKSNRVLWQLTGLGQLHGEPAAADGILVVATADSSGAVIVSEP